MGYFEIKKRKGSKYIYYVKKGVLQGKTLILRKYVGKDNGLFLKEDYVKRNIDSLVKEEFDLRKPFLEKFDALSYNPNLLERVEKKAITINYLIEANNTQNILRTEFIKEFIFNSNNIEGSRIPKEKLFELFEKGITSYKNKNEVIEVENSIKAYDYLEKKFSFNLKSIKRLYYILTKNLFQENGLPYPKGYKTQPIVVGNSPTSKPENVEKELKELLDWNKKNTKIIHPLQRAFELHSRYESTHPFTNANGRTGRLIMNKILLQNNYFPIIIYKKNKEAYFNSINSMIEGNKKKYFQFMLEQAEETYDQIISIINKTN